MSGSAGYWTAGETRPRNRRKRDRAERRQQAKNVRLELVQRQGAVHLPDAPTVTEKWRVTAVNDSADPIYDVRISLTLKPSSAGNSASGCHGRAEVVISGQPFFVQGTFEVKVKPNTRQGIDHGVLPHLEFTDANEVRWSIDSNYRLREL